MFFSLLAGDARESEYQNMIVVLEYRFEALHIKGPSYFFQMIF